MMNKTVVLIVLTFALASCSEYAEKKSKAESTPELQKQDHLIMAALYKQQSAEYEALCRQVYQSAENRLRRLNEKGLPDSAAVILDLDETVLDNSRYAGYQIHTGEPYSIKTWQKWVRLARAEAVPGAVEFLSAADELGVTLLFVSNRREEVLEATMQNMGELGIPQVKETRFYLRIEESEKGSRRNAIIDAGYRPIMYFGDQLGDFDGAWDEPDNEIRREQVLLRSDKFGSEYFILPNPVYGVWEQSLFHEYDELAPAEKDSLRKAAIKGF